MATTYRVTAPYVTLKTVTDQGSRLVGFYAGALVPDDVPADQIEHHLTAGLIAEEDGDMFAARPGEPTGPMGRPDSPLDRLGDDGKGRQAALSGATAADPDYADRAAGRRAGREKTDAQRQLEQKAANEQATPPAVADNKAAWVDYAVSQGEKRETAEAMSKEQLTGKYGKRG